MFGAEGDVAACEKLMEDVKDLLGWCAWNDPCLRCCGKLDKYDGRGDGDMNGEDCEE